MATLAGPERKYKKNVKFFINNAEAKNQEIYNERHDVKT